MMNKIKNFIVRHPYVSSILFPILYFVGVTIIYIIFLDVFLYLLNIIDGGGKISWNYYDEEVVLVTDKGKTFHVPIEAIWKFINSSPPFVYIVPTFIWVLTCITIAVGKRLIIISFWVLVFIALIILIVLPMIMPHGGLGSAKVKATTANHKEITNFMQIKFTQCSTGEASLTYTSNASGGTTTVACSTNAQGHQAALINHLKFENFMNPHNTAEAAAYASASATPPKGRTHINCLGNTCNVYTNTGDEVLSATVKKNGKLSYNKTSNKTSTFSGYCKGDNGHLFTAKKACYMGEEITYEEYNKLNK